MKTFVRFTSIVGLLGTVAVVCGCSKNEEVPKEPSTSQKLDSSHAATRLEAIDEAAGKYGGMK